MTAQLSLLDEVPVAAVRRSDPSTSKEAAALQAVETAEQWKLILRRMHDGPISADTAGTLIGKHRSTASSRIGVMQERGLVEPAGKHIEPPAEGGRERPVLHYRLTDAGRREYAALFGGVS